jgi:hypothetical protein
MLFYQKAKLCLLISTILVQSFFRLSYLYFKVNRIHFPGKNSKAPEAATQAVALTFTHSCTVPPQGLQQFVHNNKSPAWT